MLSANFVALAVIISKVKVFIRTERGKEELGNIFMALLGFKMPLALCWLLFSFTHEALLYFACTLLCIYFTLHLVIPIKVPSINRYLPFEVLLTDILLTFKPYLCALIELRTSSLGLSWT